MDIAGAVPAVWVNMQLDTCIAFLVNFFWFIQHTQSPYYCTSFKDMAFEGHADVALHLGIKNPQVDFYFDSAVEI